MTESHPSNLIDAAVLFTARRRDAEEAKQERRALEIAAQLRRMVEG